MTSFLRALLRGKQSKHKKLLEDSSSASRDAETDTEGAADAPGPSDVDLSEDDTDIIFAVKYLGSTLVDIPNGDVETSDAIKAVIALKGGDKFCAGFILLLRRATRGGNSLTSLPEDGVLTSAVSSHRARGGRKKLRKVLLCIDLKGIKVIDAASNEILHNFSIYRISYCSADCNNSRVFAFIATNANETMECHAFLCSKRKTARNATLAIAKTFNTAYELWQLSHEDPPPCEKTPKTETKKLKSKKGVKQNDGNEDHSAGHQRKRVSGGAKMKQKSDNCNFLIDFSIEPVMIPVTDKTWVSFDELELEEERKRNLKKEKNDRDLLGGSYGSINLLCFT